MKKLYEMFPTRSQRVKWALEEIGSDYVSTTVDLTSGANMLPDYTAINAMQGVPTYQTPDYTIHESVAIVLQLADENPEAGLAPDIGTAERARYYQWCIFGSAEMDFPLFLVTQNELLLPEDQRKKDVAELGRTLFTKRASVLSKALDSGPYLLGQQFSAADIVIGYNCFWSTFTGLLDEYPDLQAYLARLQERAAFQRTFTPPAQ